ncbi:ArsR/SmtB family transcription factor [Phytohabitans kaempferiae]|uniref:ArsR/SmtB family transcription factor n=1 Tax=Phytohabitans kaempferiae TaxID=1620943 RepID=A0ABV6MB48_9ACTN
MSSTFDVLAEPTRRRILDLLLERPRPVGELVEQLGLTQPGTSKHLRVLREAGLVRVRQDAQRRWYELRPEPLTEGEAAGAAVSTATDIAAAHERSSTRARRPSPRPASASACLRGSPPAARPAPATPAAGSR